MTTKINQFGEEVTKWESNVHPDNANFMQTVNWTVWVKKDGKTLVAYNLGSGSKSVFIYGLSKSEAIEKFS
jgi:hypothetical protein